jgi:ketosteroid isomerase-like protein
MTPCDPVAIAEDWLDAYRAGGVRQMVDLYSPDAVIDCACGSSRVIYGEEDIAAYWQHRFIEGPAFDLVELQVDGEAVLVTYRTSSGIVETLLDIADDGLITCCACGPV